MFYYNKTIIFEGSAYPRSTKNRRKRVSKTVSNIKSIFRRLWGGFGDGFGEDFGGPGRSWGGKREAKRRKKGDKKGRQKTDAFLEGKLVASAGDAKAGKQSLGEDLGRIGKDF